MKDLGIWDCYSVKAQTLKTAIEVNSYTFQFENFSPIFIIVIVAGGAVVSVAHSFRANSKT